MLGRILQISVVMHEHCLMLLVLICSTNFVAHIKTSRIRQLNQCSDEPSEFSLVGVSHLSKLQYCCITHFEDKISHWIDS